MQGFQNLILLTISCILTQVLGNVRNDRDTCLSQVQWHALWEKINNLNNNNYSSDCIFIYRGNLCQPGTMIETISCNHAAIVQVLHEIRRLFNRAENLFPRVTEFLMHIHQQNEHLKTCLQPNVDIASRSATVTECFQHLSTFLDNHQNTRCAWEMAIIDSMVMLQQLEQKTENRP